MRVMIVFILGSIIIGPCYAYVTPPYEGCVWGICNSDLLIEPGQIITDAVLNIENIRPDSSCLNPSLSMYLLNAHQSKLIQTSDSSKSIQSLFDNGLTPTLSAHWKLNEVSGNIASDSSGKENHAALINNPVWIDSQGLSFQGNQFLQIPGSEDLNPSAPMAVSL